MASKSADGVIKVKVLSRGAKCTTSMKTQILFRQGIEDLQNRTTPLSFHTNKLVSEMKDDGIEILNSQLDKHAVVVWIWCRSQVALKIIQRLYESNQLKDVLFGAAYIPPPVEDGLIRTSEIIQSKLINIDRNQFKKTVAVCPISVNLTERIDVGRDEICGITKLRNEIYILCKSFPNRIRAFEERSPFHLRKTIKVKEIKNPDDILSSEKENVLYVADFKRKCLWKIAIETDDQHQVLKWLTLDYQPSNFSLSGDGHVLVNSHSRSNLSMYGSNAELLRTIQLPRDINKPTHTLETSVGNFVILHWWMDEKAAESGEHWEWLNVISEISRDGQMVVRRYIPSNEAQQLNDPEYVLLDTDDQVFVADTGNNRVILLDSDLRWNRIICPTNEENNSIILSPDRMFYDEEMKQLIISGCSVNGANVYNFS